MLVEELLSNHPNNSFDIRYEISEKLNSLISPLELKNLGISNKRKSHRAKQAWNIYQDIK